MFGRSLLAGRYELRGVLGRGGMAQVFDSWDTRLDRAVAIKLLHPALGADPGMQRRFENEARAAAGLSHPHIVTVFDFGQDNGTSYIVMERLPGQTLADVLTAGPLPVPAVRGLLDDVLCALAVAHRAGVLHRDIKPGNILLSATGDNLKVADFGIAKSAGDALTATGQVVGTMCYLSPQRIIGAPATASDDLYATGVVAYEALTGRRAFPQDNPLALARAISDTAPPPLAAVRPDVDPVLADVIEAAMNRDPARRFTDADQMRAALTGATRVDIPAASGARPRPATRVLDQPVPPAPHHRVPPAPHHRISPVRAPLHRTRSPYLIGAAALLAVIIAISAFVAERPATAPASDPVSTSTAVSTTIPTTLTTTTAPSPTPAAPPAPAGPGNPNKGNGKAGNPGHGGPKKP